jgi:hypothetical protein
VAYFVWERGRPREVLHRDAQDGAGPAATPVEDGAEQAAAREDRHRPAEPG